MIPKEVLAALRTIEIVTGRLANIELAGSYTSSFRGQGLAFREVRPYQPGDDVRTIDWNVSARMNETFVKVFTEEREMTVMLAVDLSRSLSFGTIRMSKSRLASEVSALLAFSAIRHNDRVGLILGSDRVDKVIAPKRGEKHVMRVVREILVYGKEKAPARERDEPLATIRNLGARTDLKAILESVVRLSRRKSIVFLLSDFFADGYERTLSLAAAKHDLIPIVLEDPRDSELPDVGIVTFEDAESGQSLILDTSDASVRAFHKREMRRIRETRDQLFRKLGLDTVYVTTETPYVKPFRDLFARRARRNRS